MTGKVELSLQYDDSKIYVSVHKAIDLKIANSSSNTSNPYIRCYVTGVANREETMVRELSQCSILATEDQGALRIRPPFLSLSVINDLKGLSY